MGYSLEAIKGRRRRPNELAAISEVKVANLGIAVAPVLELEFQVKVLAAVSAHLRSEDSAQLPEVRNGSNLYSPLCAQIPVPLCHPASGGAVDDHLHAFLAEADLSRLIGHTPSDY